MNALVGKLFCGVYEGSMRSGIVEAMLNGTHYLVRFDQFIGFTDGTKWPKYLAIVPINDMLSSHDEEGPPAWVFFDTTDQRERYDEWMDDLPAETVVRVVPIRKEDK